MDSKYSAEMFKHLEKQSEVLMEAYRSMSHELHRLQVEEEMLMRKFYQIMTTEDLNKKIEDGENDSNDHVNGNSSAIVCDPSNERESE